MSMAILLGIVWSAQAEDTGNGSNEPSYTVTTSVYTVTQVRDPFTPPGLTSQTAKSSPSGPMVFRLDGILYEPNDPSASVNGRLVRLNKTVKISTGSGEVPVKAVEITREKVVLVVNGQKVELKITPSK